MNSFWNNVSKYPQFLISVIAGFFLTTLYPIFKLLKSKKNGFFLTIIACVTVMTIYEVVKLMLGAN